jgi:hypothetical protein
MIRVFHQQHDDTFAVAHRLCAMPIVSYVPGGYGSSG